MQTAATIRGHHSRSLVALTTFLSLVVVLILTLTGVPLTTSMALTALVVWQALGGFLVWLALRPQSTILELVGMGLAIGTAASALSGLATSTAGWGPWGCLVPTLLAMAALIWKRPRLLQSPPSPRWQLTAFLATLGAGLAVFLYALRSYPLTWTGTWSGYHPDMAFFEALANSLARFGAFESPFMSGGVVRYHWLTYAWSGQLSVITDAAPFVGITRVLPVTALIGSAAIIIAWTRRMSGEAWTPFLAGALLTMGGFVGAVFGGVLTLDSPSQALSVLWLLALVLGAVHAFKTTRPTLALALIGVLAAATILGKVSAGAPALAGIILTAIVLRLRHTVTTRRAIGVVLATTVSATVAFFLFIAGSAGGGGLEIGSLLDRASSQQGLNPLDGPRGVILGTAILALAIVPRWAGIAQLVQTHSWRWRSETWLSIGMAASSLAALLAFNSFNEIWFSVSVSGPLAATSAVGVGLAVKALQATGKPPTAAIITLAAISSLLAFIAVWWAWSSGASGGNLFVSTNRWLGPLLAIAIASVFAIVLSLWATQRWSWSGALAALIIFLVAASVPGRLLGVGSNQAGVLDNGIRNEWFNVNRDDRPETLDTTNTREWSGEQMRAAAWLRQNAEPTDVVATNLTLSPFVAATTHLPTYVSAIQYQFDYGTSRTRQELLDREQLTWNLISTSSTDALEHLCSVGVRWLWIDNASAGERAPKTPPHSDYQTSDSAIVDLGALNGCT